MEDKPAPRKDSAATKDNGESSNGKPKTSKKKEKSGFCGYPGHTLSAEVTRKVKKRVPSCPRNCIYTIGNY